jgi:hypothetical protein
MMQQRYLIFIGCLLVLSCATYTDYRKQDKFENTAEAYADALKWSDFRAAGAFLEPGENPGSASDAVEQLEDYRVTNYIVKKVAVSEDSEEVRQEVEIQYYRANNPVVKRYNDNQVWQWDGSDKQWYLQSGLPDFK